MTGATTTNISPSVAVQSFGGIALSPRLCAALERTLGNATWDERQASARLLLEAPELGAAESLDWNVPFALGKVFARMGFWRRAQDFFRTSLSRDPGSAAAWHNLAMAAWQLGALGSAVMALDEALRRAPNSALIRRAAKDLADHRRRARSLRLVSEEANQTAEGEAILQPMTPYHAEGLFYHQRGGTISVPAGLPRFDSASAMRSWIERELTSADRVPLTLIHPLYGPVGAAGLRLAGRQALCYYWVGEAIQGLGLGKRLVSLLPMVARSFGLVTLYASVYPDNVRSRRALVGSRFEPLACVLTTRPVQQDVFFLGLYEAPGSKALRDFAELCADLKLTFTSQGCRAGVGPC